MADRVRWFDEIGSTNDAALALAAEGAEEGTVVAAGAQSAGKGRHGRQWWSPPAAGVYLSVLLRPPAHAIGLLTLTAGVAAVEGIEAATGLRLALKWPNDLYVEGALRKVGGILAERGGPAEQSHVVVGLGINVRPAVHGAGVAARASSIEAELGRRVDRPLVFVECLAAVWRRYTELREQGSRGVLDAWRMHARSTLGGAIEWDSDGATIRGTAEGVDDDGALLARTPMGTTRIISGEVRWLALAPRERERV